MRARILVLLAALAVLAGACASVPGDAVATVNGETIDYARFERIVAKQSESLGLTSRDARTAQQAIDAGILDRQALDEALAGELNKPESESRIASGPPLEVPEDFVDELFEQQVASQEDLDAALADLGISSRRFREVFDRLVQFEVRGLQLNRQQDGSIGTGFPIDRSQQVMGLQQSIIQQLVQAEIARQAVEQLGIEVPDEALSELEERIAAQFPDEAALEAALEDAGYTMEDFRDLIVGTQARQQALQSVEDPAQAQAFFEDLDVEVATRFGQWDEQQGTVVPPTNEL